MNHTKNKSSTPYDDVGRTLMNDCPQLIIPLVNEAYHTGYALDEPVLLRNNELFTTHSDASQEKRVTDTNFFIQTISYHMELQSTCEGTLNYRLFEYVCQIALTHNVTQNHNGLSVILPKSIVLYLRSTKHTPNYLEFSIGANGNFLNYRVPIIKAQDYSIDEIFQKELFFLIPFYLFRFEKEFKQINSDDTKLQKLGELYADISHRLEEYPVSERLLYLLGSMTRKVTEHLAYKYENIIEKVGENMIGNILDYPAKTLYNQGVSQGISQGISQGVEKFGLLLSKLYDDGLDDIVKLVSKDTVIRDKYFEKYGIK